MFYYILLTLILGLSTGVVLGMMHLPVVLHLKDVIYFIAGTAWKSIAALIFIKPALKLVRRLEAENPLALQPFRHYYEGHKGHYHNCRHALCKAVLTNTELAA